ncbi:hypothetical protein [Robiginitalea sp. SC105]|uniref:hypothetical protein n=1 Tax=Robiginitalea sp. SC105 TaxID=2762332 RepID=UPI001639FF50|nr:hypothetical protein [Robiginitalea sp. SC105]MBC2839706.1 hypothetical protein [Robiginitalea sp. SC105]
MAWQVFRAFSIRKLALSRTLSKLARVTQSNLDSCLAGNNRLLFCSLYPFEREFLRPDRPFKRASLLVRTALRILMRSRYVKSVDIKMIRLVTGISERWAGWFLDQVHGREAWIDYFGDYTREYRYLLKSQGPRPGIGSGVALPEFRLVRSFAEFEKQEGGPVICGILTLEGLHGLGKYPKRLLRNDGPFEDLEVRMRNQITESFVKNLRALKTSERQPDTGETGYAPFFITFSHHMNNFLAGHARSFGGLFGLVFNQQPGMGRGFSSLGRQLADQLLERGPDSCRILIDTKHMSLLARKEYYQRIKAMREAGDIVPVISSHSAVNGLVSLDAAAANNNSDHNERRSFVSKFSINLTDEDIRETLASDGLIGICMHDGRMPGKKFKRKLKAVRAYKEKAKRLYAQMFLTNVFHIVRVGAAHLETGAAVAGERDPWKVIALGTDNDGIVDPFDTYRTAADLPAFRDHLVEALKAQEQPYMKEFRVLSLPSEAPMEPGEIRRLMMGQTPEQIAGRVFYGNTRRFLKTYFTDAYRYQQPIA